MNSTHSPTEVPANIDAQEAANLLPALLADREKITAALEQAREKYEQETADLRSSLAAVNAGLARVAGAIQAVAGPTGAIPAGGGKLATDRAALQDAIAAFLAERPSKWYSAGEIAEAVGTATGNRLTRALNAVVKEEGRARDNGKRGPGRRYKAK